MKKNYTNPEISVVTFSDVITASGQDITAGGNGSPGQFG